MVGSATPQAKGQPLSRLLIGQNRGRLQKLQTRHGGRPRRDAWGSTLQEFGERKDEGDLKRSACGQHNPSRRWRGTGPLPIKWTGEALLKQKWGTVKGMSLMPARLEAHQQLQATFDQVTAGPEMGASGYLCVAAVCIHAVPMTTDR